MTWRRGTRRIANRAIGNAIAAIINKPLAETAVSETQFGTSVAFSRIVSRGHERVRQLVGVGQPKPSAPAWPLKPGRVPTCPIDLSAINGWQIDRN